jgi:hypothetical protein
MTFREFYEANHPDEDGRVYILEGNNVSTGDDLSYFITFTSCDGWGIGNNQGITWSPYAIEKEMVPEIRDWLEDQFQSIEKDLHCDLQEFIDDILSRICTTLASVDVSQSNLSQYVTTMERERTLEGFDSDSYNDDDVVHHQPTWLPTFEKKPKRNRVLVISKDEVWRSYLSGIFKKEAFSPLECQDLLEGADHFYSAPSTPIILDAKNLSIQSLGIISQMRQDHSAMKLIAIVSPNCPYGEDLLNFATEVYETPASDMAIVRTLQSCFS